MTGTGRVNMALAESSKDFLQAQARDRGTNVTALVIRAVRLLEMFEEAEQAGGKVVLVDAEGKGTRVILL